MPLRKGSKLGPCEIIAPLGSGGMGEVYKARDSKLQRDVAIKVLPESLAGDPQALARFEREALAVASLSHPNILSIFDFGTEGGVAYAVMELLEGETMRARLDEGPIPREKAVDYAQQIARGLSAAHEKGVVHRDLKPENLFVGRDGHVKILDFGLAKRTEPVGPGQETSAPTDSAFTSPGTVMGTVGYMSPEQVRGLAVDQRSDIFSFGAVLYEMLSGKRAFQRDTVGDTMAAILKEEPTELSSSGRNVPPALDHVVRHCLEKDPKNRFQSARDIVFALSEASSPAIANDDRNGRKPAGGKRMVLAIAVALAVLAVAGAVLWRRPHAGSPSPGAVKRIAVLPFENLGSAEDDYFADGMADAVRGKLTSVPGIEVIARASSVTYKKTTKSQKNIANELDAPYLLTATVRWQKSGDASRVQVNPELVEVKESGAPASKWQQPFDAQLTDVFQVQSDIATRVAQELGAALGPRAAKRLSETPTSSLAAYDAFLKGEETWKSSLGWNVGLATTIAFYEQAVALDPRFAKAWARLSQARSHLYDGSPTPELVESARTAAEKAMALAPNAPETYLALSDYSSWVLDDKKKALEQIASGQRLAPDDVEILLARSILENLLGRRQAGYELVRKAERLDPRSMEPKRLLAAGLASERHFRESREVLDRALALDPADLGLIDSKVVTFLGEGNLAGARATVRAAVEAVEPTALVAYLANYNDLVWVLDERQRGLLLRLTPNAFNDGDRGAWGICLAQAYALDGDAANLRTYAEVARQAFEERVRSAPSNPEHHAFLGLSLAYLGRKEEAIQEGERAVSLLPATSEGDAYFELQLVRIDIIVGEPEKALDHLEPLLKIPYFLSPGWLRIDPNFDPLRKNPRFQNLVAAAK